MGGGTGGSGRSKESRGKEGQGRDATRLFLRVDFADGRRLGPGKIKLLEAIREHRSILAAAKAIGMSYRRAWLLVDELDRMFEQRVIVTFPGRRGAGTEVTAFGERVIALYRAMERQAAKATSGALDELTSALSADYHPKSHAEPGDPEADAPLSGPVAKQAG
ncbi:LysR family transcriptional regulator [Xanthobacter autotrophicus]|uniref:winged helix-turn-helix domain-containing protein n=1 Tax=Xanthobacter autotrophicus TaxID=280 RepID=UPI001E489B85|nr:LysR family transcriptional regulator [Xanthobacter autotrophicus]UDQ87386.1 LysR family transcriptional regulator [Xanthobacter autotrophicus]